MAPSPLVPTKAMPEGKHAKYQRLNGPEQNAASNNAIIIWSYGFFKL